VLDHIHDLPAVVLAAVPAAAVVGERDAGRHRACDEEDGKRN